MAAHRVKFPDQVATLIIFPEDEHWKAARVGHWEVLARDTARFKRRVELTERDISWIFAIAHRNKILLERNAINSPGSGSETSVAR